MKRKILDWQELQGRHRDRADLGHTMFDIRREAGVTRTALAGELGISDPHLFDMEVGNRTYREKYVEPAMAYCLEARRRRLRLIKNQGRWKDNGGK